MANTDITYPCEEVPWHGQEFSIHLKILTLTGIILKPAPPDLDEAMAISMPDRP